MRGMRRKPGTLLPIEVSVLEVGLDPEEERWARKVDWGMRSMGSDPEEEDAEDAVHLELLVGEMVNGLVAGHPARLFAGKTHVESKMEVAL